MAPAVWSGVADCLRPNNIVVDTDSAQSLSGGSINEAWRIQSSHGPLFIKLNDAGRLAMFEAESEGLQEIASSDAIRVPRVLGLGEFGSHCFLVLEYLELQRPDAQAAAALGEGLARLHDCEAEKFGWHRDNTIGTTPQINEPDADWVSFFTRRRIAYQLSRARQAGATQLADSGDLLCERLPAFFTGSTIRPSLLHGDLWGGNWAATDHQPVLFDPAVYYGDPESDIAMTELFGGFPPAFYETYRRRRPDQPGGHQRRELYRLYHVLNHFNLFGGGYAAQADRMIGRLLEA
ncbi:MAG: fructosamine kinase family protein [Gammaproteobacteria bacterium]|nr:fructosamine kinase family protein [Gammaproteobacteria bacterium]